TDVELSSIEMTQRQLIAEDISHVQSASKPGRTWLWLGLFTVLYLPITIMRAAARPMWFDELFTFYISRLSIHDIWAILSSGIEPNPPLSCLLAHFSMQMFGQNEVAVRLPE